MARKVKEAITEKVSQAQLMLTLGALWESGEGGAELSTKALGSIEKHVRTFQAQLKPTADGVRKVADAIVKRLDPLLEKGRVILDKVASLDVNSFVMGKLDLIGDVAKVSGWGVSCYDFLLFPITPSVSCLCSDPLNTRSSILPPSPSVSLRLQLV